MAKMAGRKTEWAFRDRGMRRLLKKKEIRSEEKEWRYEIPSLNCSASSGEAGTCSSFGCVCEGLDPEG